MREEEFIQKHDEILNYLLEYKNHNNDFVFSPRQNHNDLENNHLKCRLCNGSWFQGAKNYIFVALYKRGCKDNKTKTIGFVFTEDNQYIEIVFKRVDAITDDEVSLYNELISYLKNSKKIIKIEKRHEQKYFFILDSKDLQENLNYFITDVKNKADELIRKHHLESKYFISEEEFQTRINEIVRIKNTIKSVYSKDLNTMNINGTKKFSKIKNIILYGAPGVGKTHNYKNLISMIEDGKSQNEIFDVVSQNLHVDLKNDVFESIKKEKRVEFVTFHQSYSYEDFIEGFRPNESGNIELEDGIFKKLSSSASNQIKEKEYKHISFEEAYEIFREQYINGELETLKTVSNAKIFIDEFKEKSIKAQTENAKDLQYIKKNDLEVVVNGILNNIVSKPAEIRKLEVKKDTFSLAGYYFPFANKIVEIMKKNKITTEDEKNFYIVIDEINRGNISKIFGELITLIEEDKRDVYEVTLPYSKEKFKVPSNLYIIATMNSTDKSIATIDIALRRRFTFLKMKPNVDLISHVKAKELFNALNVFIKNSLNEDYMLGHSYFMKVNSDDDLEFVKEYKIKPLLEEYFYADDENYKKAIGVLNKDD